MKLALLLFLLLQRDQPDLRSRVSTSGLEINITSSPARGKTEGRAYVVIIDKDGKEILRSLVRIYQ